MRARTERNVMHGALMQWRMQRQEAGVGGSDMRKKKAEGRRGK